jgi:hypothetical protein
MKNTKNGTNQLSVAFRSFDEVKLVCKEPIHNRIDEYEQTD